MTSEAKSTADVIDMVEEAQALYLRLENEDGCSPDDYGRYITLITELNDLGFKAMEHSHITFEPIEEGD